MYEAAIGQQSDIWRVAGYERLSRDDGVLGESASVAVQHMMIEDWASRQHNVHLIGHYVDDGYSGATFDRPGFSQMISDAKRGKFNTIVVKDLSRFGRSYLDCGNWIERDLPKMGVRLYSITDDFDSMKDWDYNMALLLPMKNLMNEMQVISTSAKVRASLAAKRERGECVANFAPYGYEKDPGDKHRLVVDAEAADVVRRIFAMRLEGRSASCIARTLNHEGILPPSAYKAATGSRYKSGFSGKDQPMWYAKTVMRILRNEAYTGTLVQGKTQRTNWRLHESRPVDSQNWRRTYDAHEAIIDTDTFRLVAKGF